MLFIMLINYYKVEESNDMDVYIFCLKGVVRVVE